MNDTMAKRRGINWRVIGWGLAAVLLALPFFAMQVTDEVNWTLGDFIFAGIMFGTVGLILELAVRKTRDWTYRLAVAAAVAAGFLTIWANGAVGIIGNEAEDHNVFFNLVPLLALLGSIAVLARPAPMSRLMLAAAVMQAAIAPIVFLTGDFAREGIWLRELVLASGFLPAFWLASAALFRQAAGKQAIKSATPPPTSLEQ